MAWVGLLIVVRICHWSFVIFQWSLGLRGGVIPEVRKLNNGKWQMTNDKWQMTNDKWQMTNDKWQLTIDNWPMINSWLTTKPQRGLIISPGFSNPGKQDLVRPKTPTGFDPIPFDFGWSKLLMATHPRSKNLGLLTNAFGVSTVTLPSASG